MGGLLDGRYSKTSDISEVLAAEDIFTLIVYISSLAKPEMEHAY
jgi:hypothetical protein